MAKYLEYSLVNRLENNRLNNSEVIIEYLQKEYRSSINNWMEDALNIYNSYKRVYKDIDDCFNPATGIIENVENKQYLPINDPLDAYFEEFEKKLEKIRNPKYSKLIDLTTFKPKENAFFLNNAQYADFKKVKDAYDIDRQKYEVNLELYEKTGKNGSSPKPPTKPVVVLPNGKNHTIGRELDPLHIKDEVIKSFKREYKKALPIIEEYNAIKNMSYLELKKRVVANSPSSSVKQLIKDNELLAMTKQQIVNDVLYDYSGLADKCSESIDILTNEELDDDNYPLSKLQLMVAHGLSLAAFSTSSGIGSEISRNVGEELGIIPSDIARSARDSEVESRATCLRASSRSSLTMIASILSSLTFTASFPRRIFMPKSPSRPRANVAPTIE